MSGPRVRLGGRPAAVAGGRATSPRSIAGSSWATGSSRRCGPRVAARPSWPSTSPGSADPRPAWRSPLPDDLERDRVGRDRDAARGRGPRRARRRRLGPDHGLARRVRGSRRPAAGRVAAATIVIQAWPVAAAPSGHLATGLHLGDLGRPARPAEPAGGAQDDVARRLRLRPARGPPRRRGRCALPDRSTTACPRRPAPTSSSSGDRPTDGRDELATPSLDCAILAGHDALVAARLGASGSACGRSRATSRAADLAAADEAFLCSSVAGVLPVTRFDGAPIGDGTARPVDAPGPGRPRGADPRVEAPDDPRRAHRRRRAS